MTGDLSLLVLSCAILGIAIDALANALGGTRGTPIKNQ